MYRILRKKELSPNIYLMKIFAPRVSHSCFPGQFVVIRIDDNGERIPLSICDYDRVEGTITIVFKVVGATTKKMSNLYKGDFLQDVAGPMGNHTKLLDMPLEEIKKLKILFIAGGIGAAPIYSQLKWVHEIGCTADCIIETADKESIIFERELYSVTESLYINTEDGSYGEKENIVRCLNKLIAIKKRNYSLVIAIGSLDMMKNVSEFTKAVNIPTIVSLNPIMVDGTGMCGSCRVNVGGEIKYACVDGPEFDGHLVDFEQLIKRKRVYQTEEGRALLKITERDSHNGGCGVCKPEHFEKEFQIHKTRRPSRNGISDKSSYIRFKQNSLNDKIVNL